MAFELKISFGKNKSEVRSLENPNTPITLDDLADIIGGGSKSFSGISVTPESALTLSAVYRAVNLLSGTIASLPWHLYRRQPDDSVDIDYAHPLFNIIYRSPYHLYTSYKFRELMMGHILLLDGNFYGIIIRNPIDNQAIGIKPIRNPKDVTPVLTTDDQLWYFISGYREPFPMRDIFHVSAFGFDGIKGRTPISVAREAFGMGLTLQEFGQRFFANGSHLGGVIEHPTRMDDTQYSRFRESWERAYSSILKTGKTGILEGGAKFNRIGIAPEEAQFLQSRKFGIDEVARIFGLPPHMLMQMDSATFSNIEHQAIELVQYTLLPICKNIETETDRKLVKTNEQAYIYSKFNLDGLMRGDSASRAAYLSTMVNSGIYSRDEARALENKNLKGGLAGDLLFPLNMATETQFIKNNNANA